MKFFEQNGTLCLEFWGKTLVEAIKFWWAAKQVSYLSMIFRFYTQVLIISKSYENFLIFKKNFHFLRLFTIPPHSKFFLVKIFIYYPILMKFCMKHLYLNVSWKLTWNVNRIAYAPSPPLLSLKFKNLNLLSSDRGSGRRPFFQL